MVHPISACSTFASRPGCRMTWTTVVIACGIVEQPKPGAPFVHSLKLTIERDLNFIEPCL